MDKCCKRKYTLVYTLYPYKYDVKVSYLYSKFTKCNWSLTINLQWKQIKIENKLFNAKYTNKKEERDNNEPRN